jgi:methylmalonyl-CoA mutase cobalamin-binding subunit
MGPSARHLTGFLAPAKQRGRILLWHRRSTSPGQEWEKAYEQHLATDIVLILLLSPHFLASEVCQPHLRLALRKQQDGSAVIVPILVRPCLWQETELRDLSIWPRGHRAISLERHREAIWQEIATEISQIIDHVQQRAMVIYAPQDQDIAHRVQQDIASSRVALWCLDSGHDSDLSAQQNSVREAMRQASAVVLVASPAASNSRLVHMQMELAADYHRRVLVLWVRGEEADRLTLEQWRPEAVFDARGEHYEQACHMLLAHLQQKGTDGFARPKQSALLSEPRNPYKGLHAFTARDVGDFFGRESVVMI